MSQYRKANKYADVRGSMEETNTCQKTGQKPKLGVSDKTAGAEQKDYG